MSQLEVYSLDIDQPPTCPQCGARTDFTNPAQGMQHHTCLNNSCRFEFLGVVEESPTGEYCE